MYVEERMYTLKPGTAPEYLNYYQTHGMVGYCVTEVGTLNMIVHLWAWQAYVAKIRPLMKRQEARIMKCAPFFVDRLKRILAAVK